MRTIGVEEELLVVDAHGMPLPAGPQALQIAARRGEGETAEQHDQAERTADDPPSGAQLLPELKAQQVELGTEVCSTLDEVGSQLRFWRARADAAARAVGTRVAALATSPVAVDPVATAGERYARMNDAFGLTADEMLTCGCHVHVSIEDDEEGVAVLDRIRPWLSVLTALTANSPFWQGSDTGYASFRSQAWRRWPSAGPNEPFVTAAGYHRLVDDVLATGTVLDTGMVYFDARLSERWPTVEIRTADVALLAEDAVTLAGLVRALVETAARDSRAGVPVPAVRTEVLAVANWRAGRSGLTGELVHPATWRPAPVADVLSALLAHVRPALAEAGDEQRVGQGIRRLLARGSGADQQRRDHERTGDLAAVVRSAVALTHDEPATTAQAGAMPTG